MADKYNKICRDHPRRRAVVLYVPGHRHRLRFGLFANAVESDAAPPLISRPPGVEGFLPIMNR